MLSEMSVFITNSYGVPLTLVFILAIAVAGFSVAQLAAKDVDFSALIVSHFVALLLLATFAFLFGVRTMLDGLATAHPDMQLRQIQFMAGGSNSAIIATWLLGLSFPLTLTALGIHSNRIRKTAKDESES